MPFDKSVFVPLPPDDTFALLTEPARLRRWKTVAARIDLRAGGSYRWTVVPGRTVCGSVIEVEPGKRLVLTWGWEGNEDLPPGASTVTITLAPADGGTFVRLIHDGLDDQQLAGHALGWEHYLGRLVEVASSGDAGPDDWAAVPDPMDPLNAAEAALAILQRVLRDLSDADGTVPTPCTEFTVDALIDHLAGSLVGLATVAGGPGPAGESRSVGSESGTSGAEDRIAEMGRAAVEAWRGRGLEGIVELGPMELPAETAAGLLSVEMLVHAWDLAQATDRPIDVAPPLSEFVLLQAGALIGAGARRPDRFGPAVPVQPDADALDRLVASTGRQP